MGRLTCASCAAQAIDSSCRSLGVEALDLVQFYWHDYSAPRYVGAAQRLADLQAAGRIRHIGVTNFDVPQAGRDCSGRGASCQQPGRSLSQSPIAHVRMEVARTLHEAFWRYSAQSVQ